MTQTIMRCVFENCKLKIMYDLFSVPISITSKPQALATVSQWLTERLRDKGQGTRGKSSALSPKPLSLIPKIITTPNPEIIVAAQKDPEFLKALQSADLAIPDGVGVVWAIKLLGYRFSVIGSQLQVSQLSVNQSKTDKLKTGPAEQDLALRDRPESENRKLKTDNWELSRLSGLDLMEGMILQGYSFKDRPLKVLLLGGRPGVGEKAAEKLRLSVLSYQLSDSSQSVVGLSVAGTDKPKTDKPETENRKPITDNRLRIKSISGPQNISTISKLENDLLVSKINSFSPDLLFVAFGHGRQEKWLWANRYRLNAGVAMGVGGALDQIADPSLRPPTYINSIGLGWLYRLLREPWRWRRQLALLKFVGMVLKQKFQFSSTKLQ